MEKIENVLDDCPLVDQVRCSCWCGSSTPPGSVPLFPAVTAVHSWHAQVQFCCTAGRAAVDAAADHQTAQTTLLSTPQIWVHGSRFENSLVAVVVPSKRRLEVSAVLCPDED